MFLICKLTFQWLLIDYRYDFYVLLPSWTWNLENYWWKFFLLFWSHYWWLFVSKKSKQVLKELLQKNWGQLIFIYTFKIEFMFILCMFKEYVLIKLKQMIEIMHLSIVNWNFGIFRFFYHIIYAIYVNKRYLCPKNGKTMVSICYGVPLPVTLGSPKVSMMLRIVWIFDHHETWCQSNHPPIWLN